MGDASLGEVESSDPPKEGDDEEKLADGEGGASEWPPPYGEEARDIREWRYKGVCGLLSRSTLVHAHAASCLCLRLEPLSGLCHLWANSDDAHDSVGSHDAGNSPEEEVAQHDG